MNLLEHYINEILSVKDITNEYIERMKIFHEDVFTNEPLYEVEMNINCYGIKESVKVIWSKSEYEYNMQKGYYLAWIIGNIKYGKR